MKWVRPESVHLTLKFMGSQPDEVIEPLADAVAEATASSSAFSLRVSGTGIFPNRSRLRVLWLGLEEELTALTELQKIVENVTAGFGMAKEKRPFKPHLTLGRVRSGRGKNKLLDELDQLEPRQLEFIASEIVLFKSDLRPSGAIYTALRRLPLGETALEERS